MVLTLIFAILGTFVFLFFLQEVMAAWQKLWSKPAVKLLLPLIVVTWILFRNQVLFIWFLWWIAVFYLKLTQGFAYFVPLNWVTQMLTGTLALWLFAILPAWILDALHFRKVFTSSPHSPFVSAMLWILVSILLVSA